MTTIKLKHVDRFVDRHGKERWYFRRGKGARVVLPGRPGTPEFMTDYQAALGGEPREDARPISVRGALGSFDRLL